MGGAGLRRVRLEAAAAGAASWTGNPFLPPPREPRLEAAGVKLAGRAGRPSGRSGAVEVTPAALQPPLPLAVLPSPSLSLCSRTSSSLPSTRLPRLLPSVLHLASLGRGYKLLPRAQTGRLVVLFSVCRGIYE